MADGTLAVKDGAAASATLSTTLDSSNSNAIAPKHVILSRDGDYGLDIDANGNAAVRLYDSAGNPLFAVAAAEGDGIVAAGNLVHLRNRGMLFNGTTYDRERTTVPTTVLASQARTALVAKTDFTTFGARAVQFVVDGVFGAAALTFTFWGKDNLGVYYSMLASAAVTGTTTIRYSIGLGSTVTANVSANFPVPRTMAVSVAVVDATSATYSVTAELCA